MDVLDSIPDGTGYQSGVYSGGDAGAHSGWDSRVYSGWYSVGILWMVFRGILWRGCQYDVLLLCMIIVKNYGKT